VRDALLLLLLLLPASAWPLSVQLQWDYTHNPLAPAVTFALYRDVGCLGGFTLLADIPVVSEASQTYTDLSVSDVTGTQYCYYVAARDAQGEESDHSNVVQFLVPPEGPGPFPPYNLYGQLID
jgi:hypothetical protein